MIDRDAVWMITGCSSGLGRALAERVVAGGYRLVATARDEASLDDLVASATDRVLAVPLDVTVPEQIDAAVAAAGRRFGGIDVVVNNAGYGYTAAIEEGEDADIRALFETNVFGLVNVTRAALPAMRARRAGYVVNLSSVGGLVTFPAYGYYHMTKFAVEGFSETLHAELEPFGIGVMVVEPGAFRTKFRGGSLKQSAVRLDAYADTVGKARDRIIAADGTQENDPVRGADAIVTALEAEHPPLHLVLGGDALDLIRAKIDALRSELDAWEHVARATKFVAT